MVKQPIGRVGAGKSTSREAASLMTANVRPGRVQVLFVTWDGPHSTYLQGLFLPIFAALRPAGFDFHVLQFTWADADERAMMKAACAALGISYRSVTIRRRPIALGSLATALLGLAEVRRAIQRLGIGLVMPRNTLAALAAIPAAGRLPVLLDADGFPNEERIEFQGASPNDISYRALRTLDTWSIRCAEAITVRTHRAAEILAQRTGAEPGRFHVVANARDANVFRPLEDKGRARRRGELGIGPDEPLVIYVGSALSGKYAGEAMLQFFRHVQNRRGDARLLFLMPRHEEARSLLNLTPDLASACFLRSAEPGEVPAWIGAADLGLALIRPTFSMQAASSIKLGEYLLCGLPVLATAGVGDSEEVVRPSVGLCLHDIEESALSRAADWFVDIVLPNRETFRDHCREAGLKRFSLESAVPAYEGALESALAASA